MLETERQWRDAKYGMIHHAIPHSGPMVIETLEALIEFVRQAPELIHESYGILPLGKAATSVDAAYNKLPQWIRKRGRG